MTCRHCGHGDHSIDACVECDCDPYLGRFGPQRRSRRKRDQSRPAEGRLLSQWCTCGAGERAPAWEHSVGCLYPHGLP